MGKPTPRQLAVMRFLARTYPEPCMLNELDQFSAQHPEVITARKHVPAIRALYRKGWATPWKNWRNWTSVMTEAGMAEFREAEPGDCALRTNRKGDASDARNCSCPQRENQSE